MARRGITLQLDEGRVEFQKEAPALATKKVTRSSHPRPTKKMTSTNGDTSMKKVNSHYSPRGTRGQKYLISGVSLSMRLWEDKQPGRAKARTQRAYETVGYVITGRAELHIAKQKVLLEPGDSWVVPKDTLHHYRILEPFTAIEATAPPAQAHGRDE